MVSIILSIVTERAFVVSGLRYLPSRADTFVCALKLQSSSLLLGASHWPISRRQETVSPPRSSQPQSNKCVCVCMCVCVCVCVCVCMCSVAQSCLTLRDAMDCNPPGSSVYGILQARKLEWVAIPFSRGSSLPRDWSWVSCTAGRFFTVWAIREAYNCLPVHKRREEPTLRWFI